MNGTIGSSDRVSSAFGAHWSAVHAQAMRLVHDVELADDLAQEAFVRLWVADRAGRWPQVPRAWLSVVVTNLATSGFRRSAVARRQGEELGRRATSQAHSAHAVVDAEFRADAGEAVSAAFERLPDDRRRAVLMAGAGYSATEIGVEMGRTPAAIRTLLCRARHAMRTELIAVLAG